MVLTLVSCSDRVREIEDVRQRRGPIFSRPAPLSLPERMGLASVAPHPATDSPWRLDLPEGWVRRPPREMRELDFGVEDGECYLTLLPGSDAGALANVNRWRAQLGLSPLDAAGLAALPRWSLLGRTGPVVDLRSGDRGLLALFIETDDGEASLKLNGSPSLIAAHEERFRALAASIRPADPIEDSMAATGKLSWEVPAGWRSVAGRPFRELTLVPRDAPDTECWVTTMVGPGGGVPLNLDRWREQMSLPPLGDEIDTLSRLEVLGGRFPVLEAIGTYTDGSAGPREDFAMLALAATSGERSAFVKMVGPRASVLGQKEAFLSFCRSLRWRD